MNGRRDAGDRPAVAGRAVAWARCGPGTFGVLGNTGPTDVPAWVDERYMEAIHQSKRGVSAPSAGESPANAKP
jgi:hypothetical protein